MLQLCYFGLDVSMVKFAGFCYIVKHAFESTLLPFSQLFVQAFQFINIEWKTVAHNGCR